MTDTLVGGGVGVTDTLTTQVGEGAAPRGVVPLFPTIDAFFDTVFAITPNEETGEYEIGAYEAFILGIINRWNAEADLSEGIPEAEANLKTHNDDLAVLNDELGDAERGAVLRQFAVWVANGEDWLIPLLPVR
jgi:hypothetical protein